MKTINIFILFIILAIVQFFVPMQMIFNNESTISNGTAYKFKTRPIDPTDPFRGKYITLNYDISNIKTNDTLWRRKDKVYVYLENDAHGFAKPTQISRVLLNNSNDYVTAEVRWFHKNKKEVNIALPFNRYYMEETKAYDAEVAYREAQRDSLPNNTYALVYIKNGNAVLTDVLINDISIKDYIDKN